MKRRILSLLLILCTLFLLAGSAYAQDTTPQLPCITDAAELLTDTQVQQLEQLAQKIGATYGVGVYIVTVEDYQQFDPTGAYEAAYGIYHEYHLGLGAERNGILLLLSGKERDYALFRYGAQAAYTFTDYGLEKLEAVFLDDFGSNNWYAGCEDYIQECNCYLEKAVAGDPIKKSHVSLILILCGLSLLIAAVVCGILVGQMKSARKNTQAAAYAGSLELTQQFDQFTHRTETRRKIERSQSSGGEGHAAGRSGKF